MTSVRELARNQGVVGGYLARENFIVNFTFGQIGTILSQCSTVVRNTVVRATIKVNGKPQILGTRSPLTPQSIELKFDTDDYVGGGTPL